MEREENFEPRLQNPPPRRQPRSVAGGDNIDRQASHREAEGAGRRGEEEERGEGQGGGAERGEDAGAPPRHSLHLLVPREKGGEAEEEKEEEEEAS